MLEFTREGMLNLTRELVRIRSVSHTAGENEAADAIFLCWPKRTISEIIRNFFVFFRGRGRTPKTRRTCLCGSREPVSRTVLLNGHFDVVDTDVCGDLADLAFDADAYTAAIGRRDIPEEAREDLASGNWLFGRGVMDMKAGLAVHMAYLAHMARHRDELGVNLLFLAVPDEEGSSVGMRGSLSGLCGFIRERRLDLVAALSGEPAFWTSKTTGESRPHRVLFTGTTGKIMPLFFCIGREAHVGYAFDGVNAAAIAARVVCLMDACPDLIDGSGPDTLTPPVCLKLKDLRDTYSVTLPERAAAYFNVLTVSRSPLDMLNICRDVAQRALDETLAGIKEADVVFSSARSQGHAGARLAVERVYGA